MSPVSKIKKAISHHWDAYNAAAAGNEGREIVLVVGEGQRERGRGVEKENAGK